MPANARAILIEALRDAHRWLDALLSDPRLTLESIASREDKTVRSIRMTMSLAFLAPEIVEAAVEGCHAALVSSVSSTCRWPGRISGGRSDSKRRRRRRERSALAHLSSHEELIHPSRTGSSVVVRAPNCRSKSGAVDTWQTATLETEICGQRLSAGRARNCP
jgi:hypothetical protein